MIIFLRRTRLAPNSPIPAINARPALLRISVVCVPVLAKPEELGAVELIASKVLASDTSKYRTWEKADPSAAVELNVSECHPASSPPGIVTEVLTDPPVASPEERICGVDRRTTLKGVLANRPCAVIDEVVPGINPPTGTPSDTVAEGVTNELTDHIANKVTLVENA